MATAQATKAAAAPLTGKDGLTMYKPVPSSLPLEPDKGVINRWLVSHLHPKRL